MNERRAPFVVEVDFEVDAAYVRMTDREVARTVEIDADVNVDVDELEVVVGIELLRLEAVIPFDRLVTDFHVHSADVDLLRRLRPSIAESMIRATSEGAAGARARDEAIQPA